MSNATTKLKPKPIPSIWGSSEQLDDGYQQRARREYRSEGVRVFFSTLALSTFALVFVLWILGRQ
jgi:hypothetical protein